MPWFRTASQAFIAFALGIAVSPLFLRPPVALAEGGDPCQPPAITEETPVQTDPSVPGTSSPEEVPATPPPTPDLRLSELFPDPSGTDAEQEFIEIQNDGDADAALDGWRLLSASGRSFALAGPIGARARMAFLYAETKIPLVNTGTTLTLLDPSGATKDVVTYGPAKEGRAYARSDQGDWRWTSTPTPGAENAFDPEPATAAAPAAEPSTPAAPNDGPVAPPPPAATSATAPDAAAMGVAVTGFMPDPAGDDGAEWVRLSNGAADDARMDGWSLDDDEGGSAPHALDGVMVPAHGSVILPRSVTKLALNNDQDAVRLIAPDGAVRESVPYSRPPEGKSYELIDGTWRWLPEDVPQSAGAAAAAEQPPAPTDASSDVAEPSAIADLSSSDDGATFSVEGVVTVPTGAIGKRTFAIQQTDGLAGVFVRAYGRDGLPALTTGDGVRVVGRVRAGKDGLTFSTLARQISVIGRTNVAYAERTVDELTVADDGLAVAVTGIVTHRGKAALTIADEDQRAEIEVRARSASYPAAVDGAKVAVRGVVRARAGKVEVVTADGRAIAVLSPPAEVPSAPTAPEPQDAPTPPVREPLVFAPRERRSSAKPVFAAGAAAAAATLAFVLARRRQAATSTE